MSFVARLGRLCYDHALMNDGGPIGTQLVVLRLVTSALLSVTARVLAGVGRTTAPTALVFA